jgi:lysophospholipase
LDAAPLYADVADGPPGGRAVWLRADDGVRLRAAHWPGGERGTVLIIPGRTEYIEKYGPTAADIVKAGYHAVTLDSRGQGLADRPLKDRMVGHVARFADYQRDLRALRPLLDSLPKPLFLIAHSMGGTIGLRALVERFPVARAAFSAPMWGIRLHPALAPFAPAIAVTARALGQAQRYAPGTGPSTYVTTAPAAGNTLTTHEPTWHWMRRQAEMHPDLTLGGPSFHWLHAALTECRWLARQPPPPVPTVTLLGSAERIVEPRAIHRRMAGWPDGRLVILPGAEHEVLMEAPRLRGEALRAICDHFAAS